MKSPEKRLGYKIPLSNDYTDANERNQEGPQKNTGRQFGQKEGSYLGVSPQKYLQDNSTISTKRRLNQCAKEIV